MKVSDLVPDDKNANKGTERGRWMLERSLEKLGAGRSILLDKEGRIIAGNKTAEVAAAMGLEDVIIVQTDGRQLVAVQRTDLDLDTPQGREMAYADNRVGQVDLSFDPEQIAADMAEGLDLGDWWTVKELELYASLSDQDAKPEITRADEMRVKWGVERGQMWSLGGNMLYCGDSLLEQPFELGLCTLALCDPPFDMDEKKQAAMLDSLTCDSVAWLGASPHIYNVWANKKRRDYRWTLFWDGGRAMTVKNDKRPIISADLLLVFGKTIFNNDEALRHFEIDYRHVPHVLSIGRQFVNETKWEKPRRLWDGLVALLSNKGDTFFDPFVSSGISFLSAVRLGRVCYGIEIEPAYVGITLQRYLDATGETPWRQDV